MNPRFLAASLWVLAALLALTGAGVVHDEVRARHPVLAGRAAAVALVIMAVLANAGADLW